MGPHMTGNRSAYDAAAEYEIKQARIEKARKTRAKNRAKNAGKKKKPKALTDYRRNHQRIPSKMAKEYEAQFEVYTDKDGTKRARYKRISNGTQRINRLNNAPLGKRPQAKEVGKVYDKARSNLTKQGRKARAKKNAQARIVKKATLTAERQSKSQENYEKERARDWLSKYDDVDIAEYLVDCGIDDHEEYRGWMHWGPEKRLRLAMKWGFRDFAEGHY